MQELGQALGLDPQDDAIALSQSALGLVIDTPQCLGGDATACAFAVLDATEAAVNSYFTIVDNTTDLIADVQGLLDKDATMTYGVSPNGNAQSGVAGQSLAQQLKVIVYRPNHLSVLNPGTTPDASQHPILGTSLAWSSSLDGVLGQGATISAGHLSVGRHVITLTATDANGTTGTAVIVVTVDQSCTPATLLAGETYHDGIAVAPGAKFTKTWTIKNASSCQWAAGWSLAYMSGGLSTTHTQLVTPLPVQPGQSYVFSVPMHAPQTAGTYREDWRLMDASGTTVMVGGANTVWAQIKVVDNLQGPRAHFIMTGGGKSADDGSTLTEVVPVNGSVAMTFDASRSTVGSSQIVKYEWLSNGTVFATGASAVAPFGTPSNLIALRVTDANGQTDIVSAQLNIQIQQAPPAVAPSVSGFTPSSPQATVGNQNVTVGGSGFQQGLTVTVGFPSGGSATLSGSQILNVTSTSFTMVINFNGNPGAYTIQVRNQDDQVSNTATLNAH